MANQKQLKSYHNQEEIHKHFRDIKIDTLVFTYTVSVCIYIIFIYYIIYTIAWIILYIIFHIIYNLFYNLYHSTDYTILILIYTNYIIYNINIY